MNSMKKIAAILLLFLYAQQSFGQGESRVIFQVQSSDSLVYKSIVSQISNLKKEMPSTNIEVLCHGPGIDFLRVEKSSYSKKVQALGFKDISLVACEFTMSQRKIKKDDIVPFAITVPYGIVELVRKQQEGWIYLKAGF